MIKNLGKKLIEILGSALSAISQFISDWGGFFLRTLIKL
jgi:hypothetical protein